MGDIAREVSNKVFYEQIIDLSAFGATLKTFFDSSDGQCGVQGALTNAILAQGIFSTYLYLPTGGNLLAENIHHCFGQRDFVRELLCAVVSDHRVLSIFGPMVSDILRE